MSGAIRWIHILRTKFGIKSNKNIKEANSSDTEFWNLNTNYSSKYLLKYSDYLLIIR